jgi:TRAP-type C4-dicarboxylate transport system permease small subunit
MDRAMRILEKAMEYLVASIMFFLVTIVFIQVLLRYVLQTSLPWTEEMARYLFVWLVFIATSVCVKKEAHLGIDVIVVRFSPKVQRHLYTLSLVLSLIFSIVVVYKGYDLLARSGDQISPMLHVPMSFVYIIIPISYMVICLVLLWQISRSVKQESPPSEEGQE